MSGAELNVFLKLQDTTKQVLNSTTNAFNTANKKIVDGFKNVDNQLIKRNKVLTDRAKSLRDNYAALAVDIAAAGLAIRKGFQFIEESAKFEQQRIAFQNLASSVGGSADQIIRSLKEMSAETLSTAQIMNSASKAMVLGLEPDQLPRLMEISRAAARAFGEDVNFMFDSIVLGIGRQSRMILDNLGIIVKAEEAYQNYADTLGINVTKLTDLQKRQAFTNAVMEAGENIIKKVNVQGKSQIEVLQSLKATWEDLRLKIGDFLLLSIQGLVLLANTIEFGLFKALESVARGFESFINITGRGILKLQELANSLPGVNMELDGLAEGFEYASELVGSFADGFENNAEEFKRIATELSTLINLKLNKSLRDAQEQFKNFAGKGVTEDIKKNMEEINNVADKLGSTLETSLSTPLANMISGARSAKEAFADMGNALISVFAEFAAQTIIAFTLGKAIQALAMQLSLTQASILATAWAPAAVFASTATFGGAALAGASSLASALGTITSLGALQVATSGLSGGGVSATQGALAGATFHDGGMIRAHNGLAVGEVPIIAQTGEGVLSRRGMNALGGEGALNDLNSGRGNSYGDVYIEINYPKMSTKEEVKKLVSILGLEIERQLRYVRSA